MKLEKQKTKSKINFFEMTSKVGKPLVRLRLIRTNRRTSRIKHY